MTFNPPAAFFRRHNENPLNAYSIREVDCAGSHGRRLVLGIATAQKLTVNSVDFATLGNPTSAVETPDDRYVFVSVTNVGGPNSLVRTRQARGRVLCRAFRFSAMQTAPLARSDSFVWAAAAPRPCIFARRKDPVVGAGDDGVAFLTCRTLSTGPPNRSSPLRVRVREPSMWSRPPMEGMCFLAE